MAKRSNGKGGKYSSRGKLKRVKRGKEEVKLFYGSF